MRTEKLKKSSARARRVWHALRVVAAVTVAGVALAAGPEYLRAGSSKAQMAARPDTAAAPVRSQLNGGTNPVAEKSKTLVMRVPFHDTAERDRLAEELNPEEVPT